MCNNNPKLTQSIVEHTPRAMIAMILVSFVYIGIFFKFVPLVYLLVWFAYQVLLALYRLYNAKMLKVSLERKDDIQRNKHEALFLVSNIFQALSWTVASILSVLYAPPPFEIVTFTLIVGIITAGLLSMSSLYKAFLVFFFSMLIPQIFIMLYYGDHQHIGLVVLALIFIPATLLLSRAIYTSRLTAIESHDALEESQLLTKNILSTLPDITWLKDTNGVFIFCNPEFERIFQAKESDIVGKTDYDLFDKELADSFRQLDRNVIETEKSIVNHEWVTKAGDGCQVLYETTKTPLKNTSGKTIGVLGIGHDITKRHEAERFTQKYTKVLKMIATGVKASKIYDEIALMYEARHPGMRCSLLELEDGRLLHGGAPSMPKEYCDAVHELKNGPEVGSCGTSTYLGVRTLVEDIDTDPKWAAIKHLALPHGMRSCWSEPIKNSSGKVLGAFGMYYDYPGLPNDEESEDLLSAARLAGIVMGREHAQKRIKMLAYTDELTQVSNRRYFFDIAQNIILMTAREKKSLSLLMLDIDYFKNVNDTYGHQIGDFILISFVQEVKKIMRKSDMFARVGGEEFAILLNDTSIEGARIIAQKICTLIENKKFVYEDKVISITTSIGISQLDEKNDSIEKLYKQADKQLYQAKNTGRNRVC